MRPTINTHSVHERILPVGNVRTMWVRIAGGIQKQISPIV